MNVHCLSSDTACSELPYLSTDERWCRFTSEGNVAFEGGDLFRAAARYKDALAEAERIFAVEMQGGMLDVSIAPRLYAISQQNLADFERRCGNRESAGERLRATFDRLASVAESPSAPIGVRATAVRNLRPALAELIADLAVHERAVDATPLVERAKAAFHLVSDIIQDNVTRLMR